MKNFSFKSLVPHLIAIGIFLLVAFIISKPAFQSDTILKQSDLTGWHGMVKQSEEYKEKHGHFPMWSVSMFSGMPSYQIAIDGTPTPMHYLDGLFQLWLPKPMNWFFLACIGFYILTICLKIKPYAGIIGSLAYAYCTFSPIIITAGHETQMYALGYAPAVIGAVLLLFDKKYMWGFVLTSLFTSLQIFKNHQQISYYLFLVLLIMTIGLGIQYIKKRELAHLAKTLGLMLAAAGLALALNAVILFPTYDYAKYSKRGGQLVMNDGKTNESVKDGKTTGLSKDYAFMWSYGKAETLSLLFPGVKGYGTHYAERDGEPYLFPQLGENSHTVKFLKETLQVPDANADQIAMQMSTSLYWGDQPFTNGPVYLGAVICFLFLFGMFYLDNKHKWWILAAIVFSIMLAWGNNLAGFNYFMFDYFPLYNKFRVPTMALVIPQLLAPVIAVLVMDKLRTADRSDLFAWKTFKKGVMATGILFVLALGYYFTTDFSSENRERTTAFNQFITDPNGAAKLEDLNNRYKAQKDNQIYENMVQNLKGDVGAQKTAREFVNALRQDRASLFLNDIFRSFLFIILGAGLIALYLKNKLKYNMMLAGVTLVALIDLLQIDMKYLNDKSFDSKEKYEESEFPMTNADRQILQDKDPNYRVLNLTTGDPFQDSKTSYYHKSIGGYHAAKLGIYDDLTAYQLSGSLNIGVLDMLNTKYVIQNGDKGPEAHLNPGALGNVWFVKVVQFVNGPSAEMKALTGFNPKDTAVVDEQYKSLTTGYTPADSSASIKLTSFDNDDMVYESNTTQPHIAVFSEIYYKDWKAFIDDKPADYFKADYVLRAMLIPAGKHKIEFKFVPDVYNKSIKASHIGSAIFILMLLLAIYFEFKKNKKQA